MPRRSRAPSPPPELDRERELLRLFSLLCCLVLAGPWVLHRLAYHTGYDAFDDDWAPADGPRGGRKNAKTFQRKKPPPPKPRKPRPPCVPQEGECLNRCAAETPKSCLATYLIVGARKGGTTSLYQWLSAHPRAVGYGLDLGAEAGELQFFNHDGFFAGETPLLDRDSYLPTPKRRLDAAEDAAREERDDRRETNATNATAAPKKKKGKKKPAAPKNATAARKACAPRCGAAQECFRGACHAPRAVYAAKFPCVRAGDVAGESSVAYLVHAMAPARAAAFCGGGASLKIIAVLREPIARFQSQFQMRVRLHSATTYERRTADDEANDDLDAFAAAAARNPKWWKKDPVPSFFPPAKNGVYEGVYVAHLRRWLARFAAPDHLRVYFYEDFYFRDAAARLAEVMAYVGLDPTAVDAAAIANRSFNTHGDGHFTAYEPRHSAAS